MHPAPRRPAAAASSLIISHALSRAIGVEPLADHAETVEPDDDGGADDVAAIDHVSLLKDMLVDDHGRGTPNLIARPRLYDAAMLNHDTDFIRRFDDTFGEGPAFNVLRGAK